MMMAQFVQEDMQQLEALGGRFRVFDTIAFLVNRRYWNSHSLEDVAMIVHEPVGVFDPQLPFPGTDCNDAIVMPAHCVILMRCENDRIEALRKLWPIRQQPNELLDVAPQQQVL